MGKRGDLKKKREWVRGKRRGGKRGLIGIKDRWERKGR